MSAKNIIGQRLRKLRKEKAFSQEELAHACQMSVRTYGKIERGEANFEIDTLTKIMDVLGIDFCAFDKDHEIERAYKKETTVHPFANDDEPSNDRSQTNFTTNV